MNFLRSNYKMIIVVGLSIVLQIGVISMIFNSSWKNKKIIDSTIGNDNMETMAHGTDDLDAIDESKNNAVNGHRASNETHRDSEGIEEIIEHEAEAMVEGTQVGKTNIQVGYEHREPTDTALNKTTGKFARSNKNPTASTDTSGTKGKETSSSSRPSKKPISKPKDDKTSKTSKETDENKDTISDVKKKIIGKWKSVNDSDGKYTNMYWEFYEDGSYQNYDEKQSIVYNGTYAFSSSERIKLSIKDIKILDEVKEDKETFTSDIKFKDANNFTVDNIKHFNFTNYKKI